MFHVRRIGQEKVVYFFASGNEVEGWEKDQWTYSTEFCLIYKQSLCLTTTAEKTRQREKGGER